MVFVEIFWGIRMEGELDEFVCHRNQEVGEDRLKMKKMGSAITLTPHHCEEGSDSTTARDPNTNNHESFWIEMSDFTTTELPADESPNLSEDSGITTGNPNVTEEVSFCTTDKEEHISIPSSDSSKELNAKFINNEIVKKKSLQLLAENDGLQGIAKALKTSLDTGISGLPRDTCRLKIAQQHSYFAIIIRSLPNPFNNYTVFLLFLSLALTLGLSLKEGGSNHLRWQNEVIFLFTVIKVVLYTTRRNYVEKLSNEKLQNSRRLNGTNMWVRVVRDGEFKRVTERHLVVGDVALVKDGDNVPGDGIFISGEDPVVEGGSFDEEKSPFLEYGSRVLRGSVRMLVTAVRMDTTWGEMMIQATQDNECKIKSQIRMWNHWVDTAKLLLSFLIMIVQVLHIFGKSDDDLLDSEGAPAPSQMPTTLFMNSTEKTLTGSLCFSLLGITTVTNWVIAKAINTWRREVLIKDKAIGRDGLSFLRMANVTTMVIDGSLIEDDPSSVKEAISTLMESGIRIILVTGNNPHESKIDGEKYGILTSNSEDAVITIEYTVLTAEEFKGLREAEKKEKVGTIQIMANCDTSDKVDLIKCIQKEGCRVAFLGQKLVDAPALKHADVGISIGNKSCEVAKESSEIVILADNWSGFLVDLQAKARCLEVNIGKLIQLQLICVGSSSFINFFADVFRGESVITPLQMFCLNVAIPCCGGLVLLKEPLISISSLVYKERSKAMWRNTGIQVIYLTLTFLISVEKEKSNSVYTGFFICQIFNTVIAREPEKKNVWSGLFNVHKNKWGMVGLILLGICLGLSLEIETVLGSSGWPSLKVWGIWLVIGVGSCLLDLLGKMIMPYLIQNIFLYCWDIVNPS